MTAVSATTPRRRKILKWAIAIIALFVIYKIFSPSKKGANIKESSFDFATVTRRTIKAQISANGNVNPVNLVSVGAQVSGIVDKILVDYNTPVQAGQLLAVIDKSSLQEEMKAAEARYEQAKTKLKFATLNQARELELYEAGYVAKIELDQAETELAAANSDYVSAKSTMERVQINLGYTEIRSPVKGIIISKNVEEGQTIASSFSAPTLFVIAEDLKKMQIEASISEADVGNVKPGQSVDFTVDAFPLETFKGAVDQIRLNPKTEQNIVVYNVVIKIDNKDEKLLPGMTAFVEINTLEKKDALSVENQALQFRPPESLDSKVVYPEDRKLGASQGFVYVFDTSIKGIEAIKITKGISDGMHTEIEGAGIGEGDKIIMDYLEGSGRAKPKPQNNRGGPMGGGRR
ncbi:MAG: efflux RND transporter periplasmic adaptor subunit [Rickettsiales bacterium]|nr:efflux RND transporter periplasmic adaptor subunit [Rickettsiales bacterium]